MTDKELERLPEKVREAMEICDRDLPELDEDGHPTAWATIRAELQRLAKENAELRARVASEIGDWSMALDLAERAESELSEARETIKRLNRRVQVAEAAVAEKVKASGGSLGRALANAAADMYLHERDEARAELAALKARREWQPIETAPRDRPIIVYAPAAYGLNRIVCECQWHTDGGFCVDELRHPTHWMHLPDPPKA